MIKRNNYLFEYYKKYFDVEMSNNYEWTQFKTIAVKRLKASRYKYKEIQEVVKIHQKNLIKLNSREINKDLESIFDIMVENNLYPIKNKSKLTWKTL